ncbi:hypothetical protein, partial [Providencia stuartii]|uniref:hypothetical protein n=1 Tax=Providencia stuartii TaxID=588 RepID=UPI0019540507
VWVSSIALAMGSVPQRWAVWFNQKIEQLKNQYIKLVQTSIHYSKSLIVSFVALISVFTLLE